MKSNNFDEYRNEIKYLLYGVGRKTLYIQYKLSSLLLSKSYPDRWVNSIYFDNINLDFFNQSIEGISRRTKVRLRWYGDFHNLENPLLELKSKIGHKNIKKSVMIKDKLIYGKSLSKFFNNLINSKGLPESFRYLLKELRPVLANRYFRSYHLSANKKYRVTTDTSLSFANLITSSLNYLYWKKQKDISIVELKFKKSDDYIVNFMTEIRSRYRMAQISKYTYGLQL
jgi:SPX domain protein involved in polyphosphate accumulation